MLKGVVSNGRIELEEPLNLPDGTVLMIPLPNGTLDDDRPYSKEEIEILLKKLDEVIPFDRTPEEEARLEADRLERKAWEKAHFNERADKMARMWE